MAMLDALRGLLTPVHLHQLATVQMAAMEAAADLALPSDGEVGKCSKSPAMAWQKA